jgi:hypothetical protein
VSVHGEHEEGFLAFLDRLFNFIPPGVVVGPHLVFDAEFVFLVFLAFADTLHLQFMNGINLFSAVSLLEKDRFKYLKQSVVVMIIPKIILLS